MSTPFETILSLVRETKGILSIEGNIGAGKSTLLEQLKSAGLDPSKVVFMQEPVDQWSKIQDLEGNTILSCFYRDPVKYAFAFQLMAYISRLSTFKQTIRDHPDCELIVCERSLEADRNIFAKMMRDQESIEPMLFQIYEMMYATTAFEFPVNRIVYLEVESETCLERIKKRGREGEGGISLEYLATCERYYNDWISKAENVTYVRN